MSIFTSKYIYLRVMRQRENLQYGKLISCVRKSELLLCPQSLNTLLGRFVSFQGHTENLHKLI